MFRLIQFRLSCLNQLYTALKFLQRFIQWQVTLLHALDNYFQLIEGLFKTLVFAWISAHTDSLAVQ